MVSRRCFGAAFLAVFAFGPAVLPVRADDEPKVATLAHIKLSGSLDEAPVTDDPLFGTSAENLKGKLDRIKKAREDAKVQALLLEIDEVGMRYGKLHELRGAIADFRKSGKKVYAYLQSGDTIDYLLATACDEVCVPESGWLMLTGLRGEISFYKDLLDLIGVKAEMLQMGNYKGAAEPMTRSTMSKEFRERLESVLDDFYEYDLVDLIARSRAGKHLTPAKVRKVIDRGPYTARAAAAAGLIDRVAYLDQLRDCVKKDLQVDKLKVVKDYAKEKPQDVDFSDLFSILKLFKTPKTAKSRHDKIAVIYATGVIVTGRGRESLFSEEGVGSTSMIEAIRQAEEDRTVKAIVLRVDSPGGSALASDLIWNELNRSKKPVVASMSDVAASGGYYISMAARKIYAEPGTLTGSIGVVGGKMVLKGLYDKIGLKTEIITRGANANILSTSTPFSDAERTAMKDLMKDTYDQFLDKAIAGRARAGKKFTREEFTKCAEGRIWTGRQAKERGLVDELGTLADAIAAAKEMAGLDKGTDPELLILPKRRSFFESLMDPQSEVQASQALSRSLSLLRHLPELAGHVKAVEGLLQLRGEPVWAILPCRIEVR